MPDDTLTLFYTGRIRGDLALLPRLYTYLQTLKAQYEPRPLLLDVGESCAPDAWTCRVTGGRSALVILDGMGYHAANVENMLAPGQRSRLAGVITTAMVAAGHAWRYHVPPLRDEGIIVSTVPTPALRLCINLTPAAPTRIEDGVLYLAPVEKGQVGVVQVAFDTAPHIFTTALHTLPPDTRADASITASVDFVESEARYYARQHNIDISDHSAE